MHCLERAGKSCDWGNRMRVLRNNKSLKWLCAGLVLGTAPGCSGVKKDFKFSDTWDCAPSYHRAVATSIEYPNVNSCLAPESSIIPRPHTVENPADLSTQEIHLNAVIQQALQGSDILRSLGGSVVNAGSGASSKFDPALVESNPGGGVEAALSAFDAQVTASLFWDDRERQNNANPGAVNIGFQRLFTDQVNSNFSYEVAKTTATGARFAARHRVAYSQPNFARFLRTDFFGELEAEYRQPLLQGAGVRYNQIAGPNGGVGNYNGVLIARINTDISLADFEAGIISFVTDVESAYWELYFAYHNLEAQVAGRNSSLLTWQRIKELQKVGARGGDAAAEAQARSQYYTFDANVKNALIGPTGLYAREQNLRYLIGMPATDGVLLKPVTEPMDGEVIFDWEAALSDALTKRVEIRRQKWTIKRREFELMAARLNKRPNLDFVGRYRFNGLGDNLIRSQNDNEPLRSMYQSIFSGDFQEWYAGVEFGYAVGFRRASAAIANAKWSLSKDRAVLQEQELRISHDLSNAAREVQRNFELLKTNFNRQDSDRDRVEALQARYDSGLDNINFLLQAQQSLATSQSALYRSLVDYQLSLRDFHREKGSLLNYNGVSLSEGAWPAQAYQDAVERGRFFAPRANPEAVDVPAPVSSGGFQPGQVGAGVAMPVGLNSNAAQGSVMLAPPAEIAGEADIKLDAAEAVTEGLVPDPID
ncbi:MAG: TolC family protein [Pirellulaceae bacterium]